MAAVFTLRDDGIIEAHCEPLGGLFDLALNDAVGSRAPRGARHQGLSTYWIDQAESSLKHAAASATSEPFAHGNVTYLRLDGERVVAAYDFDPAEDEAQHMPVAEFLALLGEWRERVIRAGGTSGQAATLIDNPPPRPMGPAA